MAEPDKGILSDRNVLPTDEYIFTLIGDNKLHWTKIMDYVSGNYDNISGTWNYYNDGKQWLYKMVQKKKTIFWLSVIRGTFRITFYFGDKAEPLIENSDLTAEIKEDFRTAHRYGKIRPVTIRITCEQDVDNVLKLFEIKSGMK